MKIDDSAFIVKLGTLCCSTTHVLLAIYPREVCDLSTRRFKSKGNLELALAPSGSEGHERAQFFSRLFRTFFPLTMLMPD